MQIYPTMRQSKFQKAVVKVRDATASKVDLARPLPGILELRVRGGESVAFKYKRLSVKAIVNRALLLCS